MESKIEKETDFNLIYEEVLKCYEENLYDYLESKPAGSLTDSDVIIMIMNLTLTISSNIYYSLKKILPTTQMDFDFMKVKLINSLSDAFENIKKYNPKEKMMHPLTVEQVKEIHEKGFAYVTFQDGTQRKITVKDILVKKEDSEKLLQEQKRESVNANPPKIIIANNSAF